MAMYSDKSDDKIFEMGSLEMFSCMRGRKRKRTRPGKKICRCSERERERREEKRKSLLVSGTEENGCLTQRSAAYWELLLTTFLLTTPSMIHHDECNTVRLPPPKPRTKQRLIRAEHSIQFAPKPDKKKHPKASEVLYTKNKRVSPSTIPSKSHASNPLPLPPP